MQEECNMLYAVSNFAVLKTKLVRARMDQAAGKVFISSTMHRTFGRPQWQQLRDTLFSWKQNMANVQESMKSVVVVQRELASAK